MNVTLFVNYFVRCAAQSQRSSRGLLVLSDCLCAAASTNANPIVVRVVTLVGFRAAGFLKSERVIINQLSGLFLIEILVVCGTSYPIERFTRSICRSRDRYCSGGGDRRGASSRLLPKCPRLRGAPQLLPAGCAGIDAAVAPSISLPASDSERR